jgi:hypothetical protein
VAKLTQWRMGLDRGQISQSMTLESRSWSKVEMKTRPGVAQLGGVVNVPAWQSTREATVVEDGSQRRTDLSGSLVEGAARLCESGRRQDQEENRGLGFWGPTEPQPYIAPGSVARIQSVPGWLCRLVDRADSNGPHGLCRARLCTIMPVRPTIGLGQAR